MSRYRTIHCKIWIDDKFPFLSDDSQLAWFHAYTCPFSNGIGIYHASIESLAASKRWSIERYRRGLAEPLAKVMVRFDERYQVVYFPSFFKYNRPSNPNTLKGLLRLYDEVPWCDLKMEAIQQLKTFAEGWGKPFLKVVETLPITFPKQEQEQEQYLKNSCRVDSTGDLEKQSETRPSIPYSEIMDYLNHATGKKFRATNESTKRHISARWSQGYRLEEFKTVIDNKVRSWRGTEHEKYLRPETLFGTKFDSYLNETSSRIIKLNRAGYDDYGHRIPDFLPDVSGVYGDGKQ